MVREVLALLPFTYKKKITKKGDIKGKPWF